MTLSRVGTKKPYAGRSMECGEVQREVKDELLLDVRSSVSRHTKNERLVRDNDFEKTSWLRLLFRVAGIDIALKSPVFTGVPCLHTFPLLAS